MCAVSVDEFQDGIDVYSNLFASVTMKDSKGNVVGQTTVNNTYPLGMPINTGNHMLSSLTSMRLDQPVRDAGYEPSTC